MVSTLAFDLGASSGRAVVGHLDDGHLAIETIYSFPNEPVWVHNHLYWDVLQLLHKIKQGLITAHLKGYGDIQSIGIDTWGVDFGLLGTNGELLGNPYHYRDPHTRTTMEEVEQFVPRQELFAQTGIQFLSFNTLYQLYALQKVASPLLEKAETLLLMPELLRYFLTGERMSEWTIASTTQLCDPHMRTWNLALIEKLGIPSHLFSQPVPAGTIAGKLLPKVAEEVGLDTLPVIAVAEHDTASAVAAVPADHAEFAYLSSGTWSLIGTEIAEPMLNDAALELNITNEGGINGTVRLLKNVTGLWLIQECRRIWRNEGKQLSYEDEGMLIAKSAPFQAFIDPDDPMFLAPAHMPRKIQQYCHQTGQPIPESEGALLRCIVESLALRYRFVLERIESLIQKRFAGLHIVGGGSQHAALCQYTANALGRPVWAGPQEATAIGNLLVQLIALGKIKDIQQARQIVRHSFPLVTYEPGDRAAWEQAYKTFLTVTKAN
ncbi:L-fuculose kinase [Reticulibacter mediterranei]|uniref:L-fuculose kinase n=1 Tax=Reticulibacter mediterranei TaxID=2778369 RepID=A0A8J3I8N6_9CHLR|nr:rhamnulokinase family protein [Reticulibacter mediterranei]GHO90899.1 L-fuculose kinase [Reticulibacter mediterranei]